MTQTEPKKSPLETGLIPWWSYGLAAGVFIGLETLIYPLIIEHRTQGRPVTLSVIWSISLGLFLSFYMLMVGYVLRDSRRRGMNPLAWTLIMLALMPSGLGFVIYFLLRSPIVLRCPKCEAQVGAESNFCTRCRFQLRPVCEHCQHSLRAGDSFCAYCGSPVSESQQLFAVR